MLQRPCEAYAAWKLKRGYAQLFHFKILIHMKDDHDDIKDFDFDTWFNLFRDRVRRLGYKGVIDKQSFEDLWDCGTSPESAADDFVLEMTQ